MFDRRPDRCSSVLFCYRCSYVIALFHNSLSSSQWRCLFVFFSFWILIKFPELYLSVAWRRASNPIKTSQHTCRLPDLYTFSAIAGRLGSLTSRLMLLWYQISIFWCRLRRSQYSQVRFLSCMVSEAHDSVNTTFAGVLWCWCMRVKKVESLTDVLMSVLGQSDCLDLRVWDACVYRWSADGRVWPLGVHDHAQLGWTVSRCLAAWSSQRPERMWVRLNVKALFTPAGMLLLRAYLISEIWLRRCV